MKSNLKPQIIPTLIWREVDGNTVIVSPQSGKMRVLNGVGSEIWRLLADHKAPDFIITHLASRYKISLSQAESDLEEFLADLDNKRLLEWTDAKEVTE